MSSARILIIEDEILVARDLEQQLIGLGYQVVGLGSRGEEATRLVQQLRPDLVLMDVRLQGSMDGITAADLIRQGSGTPVVYLTAHADEATLRRARLTEPFGYLLKPFEDRELRTMIEMALYKHQAEQRLRDSEARKTAILASALDAIVVIDHRGLILDFNPAAEKLFGHRRADVLDRPMADLLVPPAHRERHRQGLATFQDSGQSTILGQRLEMPALCADGSEILTEMTVTTFQQHGMPCFVGFLRDITQQKHLEEQLRQAQRMESVGQLAGGIAHDFNNLLTVIIGYVNLVLHGLAENHPWHGFLSKVLETGDRAADLVRQLLAFSRKQMLQPRLLDLNEVVTRSRDLLEPIVGDRVRIQVDLTAGPCPVLADPAQLEQVLIELGVNARDAMPEGGELQLRTSHVILTADTVRNLSEVEPGPHVRLEIRDTGRGIPAEVKARIFEPFFTTKEVGKGSGLGLAATYGVIKQTGGHLDVESTPGKGTTFTIYLPTAKEEASSQPRSTSSVRMPGGKETVLLVEDEPGVRQFTRHVLEGCGYRVLEASNGPRALEMFDREVGPIDVLVTDLLMPQMSGQELALRIRQRKPQQKVLFLSGFAEVRQGLTPATVDIPLLEKPFTPLVLTRTVRALLDQP